MNNIKDKLLKPLYHCLKKYIYSYYRCIPTGVDPSREIVWGGGAPLLPFLQTPKRVDKECPMKFFK